MSVELRMRFVVGWLLADVQRRARAFDWKIVHVHLLSTYALFSSSTSHSPPYLYSPPHFFSPCISIYCPATHKSPTVYFCVCLSLFLSVSFLSLSRFVCVTLVVYIYTSSVCMCVYCAHLCVCVLVCWCDLCPIHIQTPQNRTSHLAHDLSCRLPVTDAFKGSNDGGGAGGSSGGGALGPGSYAGICLGDPDVRETSIADLNPDDIRSEFKRCSRPTSF